jgi:hypothetical protein
LSLREVYDSIPFACLVFTGWASSSSCASSRTRTWAACSARRRSSSRPSAGLSSRGVSSNDGCSAQHGRHSTTPLRQRRAAGLAFLVIFGLAQLPLGHGELHVRRSRILLSTGGERPQAAVSRHLKCGASGFGVGRPYILWLASSFRISVSPGIAAVTYRLGGTSC